MSDEKKPREFDIDLASRDEYGFYNAATYAPEDRFWESCHVREVINDGSVKKTEADDRVAELERQNTYLRKLLEAVNRQWRHMIFLDDEIKGALYDRQVEVEVEEALKACEVKGNE